MANTNRRLIPISLQNRFVNLLTPLIKILSRWGMSPNGFTLAGLIITSIAAAAFIMGYLRLGGLLILLGGLCDAIDGSLARFSNKTSLFGAMFDSAVDRYSEFVMFFGILVYFVTIENYPTSVVIFFALCGSIMVSYSRARAESLGFNSKVGIMQRPERIVFLGLGALIHPVALKIAIWLVAIFANFTALQRIRHTYRQSEAEFDRKPITEP